MGTQPNIRLMLVDDTALFRASLREILYSVPSIEVIAEAEDDFTAEEVCLTYKPSCDRLISDLRRVYEGKCAIPEDLLQTIVNDFLHRLDPLPATYVICLLSENSRSCVT